MTIPTVNIEADLTQPVEKLYEDSLSPTIKELSKLGVDTVKCLRLTLFPIQAGAYYQEKIERFFKEALDRVPENERIAPIEPTLHQITDKLKLQEEGDLITEMYLSLLECAFDKRRFGQVHPSFLNIVSQLSADEAILMSHLSRDNAKIYFGREPIDWAQSQSTIKAHFSNQSISEIRTELDWNCFINPDVLSEPKYLQLYIEHLKSLGLIEYVNDISLPLSLAYNATSSEESWAISHSRFGQLFHETCTRQATLRANKNDRIII